MPIFVYWKGLEVLSLSLISPLKQSQKHHLCLYCPYECASGTRFAIAVYLLTTNLKGVSNMKLHRDLGIMQKSTWHPDHRLRESFNLEDFKFSGTVEVDEAYMGGLEKNKHESKKLH